MSTVSKAIRARWMIRSDLDQVMALEQRNHDYPWSQDDLVSLLRSRYTIAMVLERDEAIVGFFVYELLKQGIFLWSVCADRDVWHKVFEAAIEKLKSKLSPDRRRYLEVDVPADSPHLASYEAQGFVKRSDLSKYRHRLDCRQKAVEGPLYEVRVFEVSSEQDLSVVEAGQLLNLKVLDTQPELRIEGYRLPELTSKRQSSVQLVVSTLVKRKSTTLTDRNPPGSRFVEEPPVMGVRLRFNLAA